MAGLQDRCVCLWPTSFAETVAEGLVGLGYQSGQIKTERFGGTGGP
jgi:hypothetical protein